MITFKSPITLALVAGSLAATLVPGTATYLSLQPFSPVHFLNPLYYAGVVGHIFIHSSLQHWASNMALLLLLAPAIEKAYGSVKFVGSLTALTFLIGLSQSLFLALTQKTVVGASDLVFALIIMTTFAQSRRGEIPLTSLLVAILWGVHELGGLVTKDSIANSAHLVGAVWGFVWGLWLMPKEKCPDTAEPSTTATDAKPAAAQ